MATSNNDRISSQRLLDTLKGLQANRHLGSEPEVDPQTNEKTKHTIKQDYLPNADWNVNDPDADGYVQGRTHWVEEALTGVIPSAGTYNSLQELNDALNSVEPSVVYVCDEYNVISFPVTMPEYTDEPVAVLDKEFELEGLRVLGPSDWDGSWENPPEYLFFFKQEAYGQNNVVLDVTADKMYRWKAIAEVAHKLDRKFYDYTEPFDPTGYTKDSDISIKTMPGPYTHFYDFVRLPNGLAYGNIKLHVNSWDDTTKTGTFSTAGTPLANPGSMVGGTAYVNGGIVFFTVEADGSNPRISNPIPSDLLVANRADMWIPQMFIRKEDE